MRILRFARRLGFAGAIAITAVAIANAGTWLDSNGGTITAPDTVIHTQGATGNALHVIVDSGGGGSSDVNLQSVGGNPIGLGATTAANSLPVALATDGTLNVSGSVTASGTMATTAADGSNVTLGTTTDAKSAATDSTSVTIEQVLKQISASVQAPPSQAVTNAGTFAVQIGANSSVNEAQINGVTPLMGNGTTGTGSARVTIASDNTAFSVNAQPTPATSGGLSTCYLQAAASTNATNCKASAGQIYHIVVTNNSANIAYLRLYNLSSAPTCTSATGFVDEVMVPAPAVGGGGFVEDISQGQAFSTGIGFCFSGGIGNTDNTNVAASAYMIKILYK